MGEPPKAELTVGHIGPETLGSEPGTWSTRRLRIEGELERRVAELETKMKAAESRIGVLFGMIQKLKGTLKLKGS